MGYHPRMCRSIRTLHNFAPPATEEEMRAAALQYVRKVAGVARPSQANAAAFDKEGWTYWSGESFDLFYPGYGDSWPSLNGAIGMTYEQAGQVGVRVKRRDEEDAIVKRLKAKGYDAYVLVPEGADSLGVFRVRIGSYKDKHQADMIA